MANSMQPVARRGSQLQSFYGIYADEGPIFELAKLTHLNQRVYQVVNQRLMPYSGIFPWLCLIFMHDV